MYVGVVIGARDYTLRTTKLLGGFTLSILPSVRHPVSALWRLQFCLDPFRIDTSYHATSESVLHVKFLAKFKDLNFWQFLAATKQLYEWYFLSVCPSVTPFFWLCSHHRIIMKFSGVITNDQGKVHAKGQGQRSKVKVTEVTTQLNRFWTVTPVWIHIWWWNDTYSLMLLRRGALLFFKVIRLISRSHGSKNRRIWPKWGVSGL